MTLDQIPELEERILAASTPEAALELMAEHWGPLVALARVQASIITELRYRQAEPVNLKREIRK